MIPAIVITGCTPLVSTLGECRLSIWASVIVLAPRSAGRLFDLGFIIPPG